MSSMKMSTHCKSWIPKTERDIETTSQCKHTSSRLLCHHFPLQEGKICKSEAASTSVAEEVMCQHVCSREGNLYIRESQVLQTAQDNASLVDAGETQLDPPEGAQTRRQVTSYVVCVCGWFAITPRGF